jgi:hypothetical protein
MVETDSSTASQEVEFPGKLPAPSQAQDTKVEIADGIGVSIKTLLASLQFFANLFFFARFINAHFQKHNSREQAWLYSAFEFENHGLGMLDASEF